MKKFALAAAAATLLAGSALAQGTGNLNQQQPYAPSTQAPSFQQGSGQRAGGPANELNSSGPSTTGTVVTSPSTSGTVTTTAPEFQQGSGQRSGGPANELNTSGTRPAR